MAEFSGLKSGWLKGRKGSVEGWFPEDFVMPVLSDSSHQRHMSDETSQSQHRADDKTVCQSDQYISNSYYTNLPTQ